MTDLTKIPGIGKNMAQHLTRAGYPNIDSLKGQGPDEIYAKDCFAQGFQVDRCGPVTAIGWRFITSTTTGSYRRARQTGGIGRIKDDGVWQE
jgi:hypothetical protein